MNAKKILPWLLGGGLVVAAIHFARKGFTATKLNVKISSFDFSLRSPSIILEVINPTSNPIGFNSITADVQLNGRAFSTINTNQRQTINGNSSARIKLPIRLNPVDGLLLLADIAKRPSAYTVNVTGTINSDNVAFPINTEYRLR